MKTLLIVYHSMTGGTLQMAEAAARGARSEPDVRVALLKAAQAAADDVLAASAYIFACPENLAAMSGQMRISSIGRITPRWTGSMAGPTPR